MFDISGWLGRFFVSKRQAVLEPPDLFTSIFFVQLWDVETLCLFSPISTQTNAPAHQVRWILK